MISMLFNILFFTIVKLLMEGSFLIILMTMEMVSLLSLFLLLSLNSEALSLSSCVVAILSVVISESVLGLSMLISLMRFSTSEKTTSFMLK